jgi:hypothetical protein
MVRYLLDPQTLARLAHRIPSRRENVPRTDWADTLADDTRKVKRWLTTLYLWLCLNFSQVSRAVPKGR